MPASSLDSRQVLTFPDLASPVLLERAEPLLPLISTVLSGWQFATTDGGAAVAPCMTITGREDGDYICKTRDAPDTPRRWDAVNAVCELVVELAWEQIRSHPDWLCLHCAAVEIGGRLVLFPNRRKAGKSTLTAVLAARGHRVLTDDFLPVQVGADGVISGRANGILPRIRLPLPAGFGAAFTNWAAANPGPRNAQYKYLRVDNLAPRGTTLPIGAIVVLDRNGDGETALAPIPRPEVLDALISQNFARTLHSGKILLASQGVAETAELFRADYASAEDLADLLEARFRSWDRPIKPLEHPQNLRQDGADLSLLDQAKPALRDGTAYRQASGVTEVHVDDVTYLADRHGIGVHRLNPVSAAIWQQLDHPALLADIAGLLRMAFPDVPRAQIEGDARAALDQFVRNRLIEPAGAAGLAGK